MWRLIFRWWPIHWHRSRGSEEWEGMDFSKFAIFDIRVLGAIAAVLLALVNLRSPDLVKKIDPSRVARGKIGAENMSFALSPTGEQMAATNTAGRVTLWAQENEWQTARFLDFPGFANDVAFSSDGRYLAAVGVTHGIFLWDLRSTKCEPTDTIEVSIERPNHVLFSPDGQSLAITSDLDGTILLLELATRRERMVLHRATPVTSIAFSPDGRWLATGERNNRLILLWDVKTRDRRVLLEDGPGAGVALAFSPDGSLLASVSHPERHVRLWDLKAGSLCRVFDHPRSVNSVAFSSDGSLLATACNDGLIRLWTMATGQRRVSLDSQVTYLNTVAFSPDGRTLILASGDDDSIRMWDIGRLLRASGIERQEATFFGGNLSRLNQMWTLNLARTSLAGAGTKELRASCPATVRPPRYQTTPSPKG
jgi:sugar lactone lactonase YvrE